MIDRENVRFARSLIKSISIGIDKVEFGSEVETAYIFEKIQKLWKLVKNDMEVAEDEDL